MASESLGFRLRNLRIASGRGVRQQAKMIGIDHATLIRWESGDSQPNRTSVTHLLTSLGLTDGEAYEFLQEHFDTPESGGNRELWSGSTIRALRLEQGLSQSELASVLQVKQGTISKWEKGASLPSTSQLDQIQRVLTDSKESLLTRLISLRNDIEGYDLNACFASYDSFWRTCSTHQVEYGEHWGAELTKRVEHLAQADRDAVRLQSWIYASRAYWSLVRGRHSEVLELAAKAIKSGDKVGFDLTSSYAFWIAARVFFTKRTITRQDQLALRRIANLTEKKIGKSDLPFYPLVRSSLMLQEGNSDSAHRILSGIQAKQFEGVDEGQCGRFGGEYWENILAGYHKLYGLQSREYAAILSRESVEAKNQPVATLLSRTYDLAALTKLSNTGLATDYNRLTKDADDLGLGFALSTMESHVKRISGIDLRSRCLG